MYRTVQNVILTQESVPEEWERPWLEDVPEIEKSVEKTIKFASEDEDDALVVIGFRGPSAISELRE